MGQSLMKSLFSSNSIDPSRSKSYLYLQDPFIGSFSSHFMVAQTQQSSLQTHNINLDDYIEDQKFTFFVQDTPKIKLRRVRPRPEIKDKLPIRGKNESYTMKYISIDKNDEASLQLYLTEAEILCQLEHNNVVKAFGYGVKDKGNYRILGILMEFFENNLQKKINENISKQKFFSKDQITSMITPLISGLLYLQFKRIFHGNIKPENILISGEDIKISNFSCSHDFSNERSTVTNDLSSANQNNGSLYWSPEFRRAYLESKPTVSFNVFKIDTFAFGLLIAHLVSLAPLEVLYKILESCESSQEKTSLYKMIEGKYDRGIVDLIRDLANFDEDERKTVCSLCFAPKKSYEKFVCKEISQFYNLNKTDKNLYKSIRVLGSGGFGEVKEVKNTKTNEKYAEKTVKFIDSRCLIDSMEEVLINASMDHENIVKFYYYDIEEVETRSDFYNLYCYIELMDRPLDAEIKKRSKSMPKAFFDTSEIDDILLSMAKAMKYMQETRNTSHSDIKPQNILISQDNKTYKLCDFGISRPNLPKMEITSAMTIKGSPLYLAPELREENDGLVPRVIYNPFKSDIFSLGLSLLSMVTLESFHRDKEKEKKNAILWFLPENLQEIIKKRYDEGLLELLKEMLKYDYRERLDYLGFYKKVYYRWKTKNFENNKEKYDQIKENMKHIEKNPHVGPHFTSQINKYLQSLQIYEDMGDYEGMAYTLMTLGNLNKELGLHEKAQMYYEKSLELGCQTLGFDHPRIALMLNNLGVVYIEFGAFPRAKTYFLQAIDIQIKNFGPNDQKIVTFQLNLASLYLKEGDLENSIKNYTESLKLAYRCYEGQNLEIAIILNNLGSAYRRYKKKEKNELALGFYTEAYGIYQKNEEIPLKYRRNYAELLENLSKLNMDLKKFKEAKGYLEESLKIYIELYGVYHKLVGFNYHILARLYRKLGDLRLALENQLKAVEILENLTNKIKENKEKTSSFNGNITCNDKKDKDKKHNSVLLEIPSISHAFSTNSSPVSSPKKIAKKKWSFFETATEFLHNTSNKEEKTNNEAFNINNKDLFGVLNNLGIIYQDLKDFEKAREAYQKALNILRLNKLIEDDYKMAEILNNLASCYIESGTDINKLNKAKELLEEGVECSGKSKSNERMKEIRGYLEQNLTLVNRKIKLLAKK